MFIYVLLTILLLVYGFINIPLVNQLASPFIAVILIYFLWKDKINQIDNQEKSNELKNELTDIKKLLTEHEIKDVKENSQNKSDEIKDK